VANNTPLTGEGDNNVVTAAGINMPLIQRPIADIRAVSPDYFRTIGISLRAGRAFTDADRSRAVGLLSAMTAAKLWPGQNPMGRELIIGDNDKHPIQVLGTVGHVHGSNLEKSQR
jgi:putative ABC transport system permease protein